MIGKKMLMWIGAGLLSAASVPAIAATRTHLKAKHLAATPVKHTAIAHAPAVKLVSHAKSTKLATTTTKKHKTVKLAKSVKPAKHTGLGVVAMHSGHATLGKPAIASAKSGGSHLLAATTKVKLAH